MKTNKNIKPTSTFEQQIDIIKKHGFVVYEEDYNYLISFLNRANYYRFSAYFLPFYTKKYRNTKIDINGASSLLNFNR